MEFENIYLRVLRKYTVFFFFWFSSFVNLFSLFFNTISIKCESDVNMK
jgi:hypothetical protein